MSSVGRARLLLSPAAPACLWPQNSCCIASLRVEDGQACLGGVPFTWKEEQTPPVSF